MNPLYLTVLPGQEAPQPLAAFFRLQPSAGQSKRGDMPRCVISSVTMARPSLNDTQPGRDKIYPARLLTNKGCNHQLGPTSLSDEKKKDECSHSVSNTVRTFVLVRQKGFEPPTFWFVAKHSIQLSYWRISQSCSLTAYI